jgi:arsenate reductase
MIKVYGIPNCNSVKKAITWLKEHNLEFEFHDFKKEGVTSDQLKSWSEVFGWEQVLNKKGTTWKKLTPEQQSAVIDESSAAAVMVASPSMIKRPVIADNNTPLLLGFDEARYEQNIKR